MFIIEEYISMFIIEEYINVYNRRDSCYFCSKQIKINRYVSGIRVIN